MKTPFTFFYRSQHPFSQWYDCTFEIEGQKFNCAEQYMMYGKAVLFGDAETALNILAAKTPREQKALGRQVRHFDSAVWDAHCEEIVYKGNYAKFTQNENLLKFLLKTEGTELVEASPTDTIWGIGLTEDDPRALDKRKWRGKNLLGKVLTRLRDDLLA